MRLFLIKPYGRNKTCSARQSTEWHGQKQTLQSVRVRPGSDRRNRDHNTPSTIRVKKACLRPLGASFLKTTLARLRADLSTLGERLERNFWNLQNQRIYAEDTSFSRHQKTELSLGWI
jgi:hypothetical protein